MAPRLGGEWVEEWVVEGGKEDWWVEMDGWGVMGGTVGG